MKSRHLKGRNVYAISIASSLDEMWFLPGIILVYIVHAIHVAAHCIFTTPRGLLWLDVIKYKKGGKGLLHDRLEDDLNVP